MSQCDPNSLGLTHEGLDPSDGSRKEGTVVSDVRMKIQRLWCLVSCKAVGIREQ